jgi:hypothetical protein
MIMYTSMLIILPSSEGGDFPEEVRPTTALETFTSIFDAARDLRHVIKEYILPGTGLQSMDDADILFCLLMVEMGCEEAVKPDAEGFILVRVLRGLLVREQAQFSRQLLVLAGKTPSHKVAGFIELERNPKTTSRGNQEPLHGNSKRVRLSEAGRKAINIVYTRYESLANQLLAKVPQEARNKQVAVNEFITRILTKI